MKAAEALMEWLDKGPSERESRRGKRSTAKKIKTEKGGDWIEQVCTYLRYKWAIGRMDISTAVGEDGFSAYLLRMAPEDLQREYYECLKVIIRERTFPPEWLERVAVMAMKPGEHPAELGRRRDLWIEAHGSKITMLLLGDEYERAARNTVPSSQGGFMKQKAAPGRTLILRFQQEQCASEQTP